MSESDSILLSLHGLSKCFGSTVAVRDVSVDVYQGECLAIVGESGSGKTTLANMILGIIAQTEGEIRLEGSALTTRRTLAQRRAIQFVQQNPLSSLNPKRSVGASVRLGLDVYNIGQRSERWRMTEDALREVGLEPELRTRPPAALSGGQRQRVAIARALACQSRIVVLDEPTSALDVLVQARVLRLLNKLRRDKGLTYIFITHDLSVVRNMADRVAVFQSGELVELAATAELFDSPRHEYTRRLLSAIPVITSAEIELQKKFTEEPQV